MPTILQLDLTLEDFFSGKSMNLSLQGRTIKLVIEPGMMGGQELIMRGQISDPRGGPNKDLIFRLRELQHAHFSRRNADLIVPMRISLKEAILGFKRPLKHLDGKEIWIKTKKGEVLGFDDILVLPGQGMPVYKQPGVRGRLFIKLDVEMPKFTWLEGDELNALEQLLAKIPNSNSEASSKTPRNEQVFITPIRSDLTTFGSFGAQASDEDDERYEQDSFSHFFFR
jgi:DnaJ family protein A protein 2